MALAEDKAISEVESRSAGGDGLGQMDHDSQAYRTARMDIMKMAKQVQPDVCAIVKQVLQEALEKEESIRQEACEEAKVVQSEVRATDTAAQTSYCHQEGG